MAEMNRDELKPRYKAALNRHWRSSIDRSGPTQELLDELVTVAEDYARRVTIPGEAPGKAAGASPVAATGTEASEADGSPSHRTRTRPRRNPA